MPVIPVEIDIPAGFVATGEYRSPQIGEWYLSHWGTACQHTGNAPMRRENPRLILANLHTPADWWPEWLRATWVAKDSKDRWRGYFSEPELWDGCWRAKSDWWPLPTTMLDIKFPQVAWNQSKFRNPHDN